MPAEPARSPTVGLPPPTTFHVVSHWRVRGTCGEVADVLDDPLALVAWWPSVYLSADELTPPGSDHLGQRVAFVTQGWLPYTLRWQATVVERRYPTSAAFTVAGDFEGSGIWRFTQDGAFVDITFDWRVEIRRPLFRALAPVLRSLFEANHRWAMQQGETSLALELERRRAVGGEASPPVPPPPGPVTYAAVGVVVGAAVVGGTLFYLLAKGRRRRARATARSDS
jgi:hypothetical protein